MKEAGAEIVSFISPIEQQPSLDQHANSRMPSPVAGEHKNVLRPIAPNILRLGDQESDEGSRSCKLEYILGLVSNAQRGFVSLLSLCCAV